MKRKLITVGVLVVVAAAAVFTFRWYREQQLDQADKEGRESIRSYYRLIGTGVTDESKFPELKNVLAKMQEVSTRCRDDVRQELLTRRMDGSFIVGDYETAEKLMDECTENSASYREGAKAKIRAHAAIVKGDHRKAVAELDSFIQMMLKESSVDVEIDPSNDESWTREMIVAKNYFRMAVLAANYDKKLAEDYKAKANSYIEKARKSSEVDEDMLKTIDRIVKESDKL